MTRPDDIFAPRITASSRGDRPGQPRRILAVVVFALIAGVFAVASPGAAQTGPGPHVLMTTVKAPITPVIADHIADGIAEAERGGYEAYLIRLDTPGGLETSMRDIVQHIFAAEVPVVVHISPPGARGASAGAIITFAAHVAAMAPGTSIGAATPVDGGTGSDLDAKIINESIAFAESIAEERNRDREFITDTVRESRSGSASEALSVGAIDVVAGSTSELLDAIDGITVRVGATEREVTLATAGAAVDEQEMGFFRSIQQVLADPNIAFLLLSVGTLGLIYELASPGLGVGAVLGLTFITLGLFGLAVLSVNLVGLVFLLLAAALFVAEVFAPGLGLAAAGGAFALVLSGVFLFDDAPGLQVSLAVVLPVAIVVGLFVVIAGRVAMRARRAPSTTTGHGVFIGHTVEIRRLHGRPQVFVEGAWWSVRAARDGVVLVDGAVVEVVDVDGLQLVVDTVAAERPAEPLLSPPMVNPSMDTPPAISPVDGQPEGAS
ncbi:nodulation protein NfeD [soil metagenome]